MQRLATRVSPATVATAVLLLARIDKVLLTPAAVTAAAGSPPPQVRTLDALHIASAAELAELEALVTYDDRMAEVAAEYGLPVQQPS